MNATKLLKELADFNSTRGEIFFVENENHDINIWFSRKSSKWILELNGKIIMASKFAISLVNKLQDINLLKK
jgi:hypothetical protein|tara:strand:+ start:472 stop:687 length:216 start_codon:yes stop_codon:yes gene_type:complete